MFLDYIMNLPLKKYLKHQMLPMNGRLKKFVFLVSVLLCSFCAVSAQESIYSEINYPLMQKLVDAAKENFPKMKIYQRHIIMAKDNITKTKKSWFNFFSFSANYSPTNSISISNYVLTGYQFGIGVNFATLFQTPFAVKDAKNQLILANLDKEEYDLNLETTVKTLYIKYIQQIAVLKLQSKTEVDVEANYKQTKYKFEKGEESFEAYNKALISLTEMKQNIISSEGNVLIAKYGLEEIIGKKLEEIR